MSEKNDEFTSKPAKSPEEKWTLRRYTDLASLLDILNRRQLTLLDPFQWEDQNDVHFLMRFKQLRKYGTLQALCFTQVEETHHHWYLYAKGACGVCIEFDGFQLVKLMREFGRKNKYRVFCRDMSYMGLKEAKLIRPEREDFPFLKRRPFQDEKEYRVLMAARKSTDQNITIPLPEGIIRQIHYSPWLPPELSRSTSQLLRSISGNPKLKISRTTLLKNEQWKKLAC